jgi:signal transduction histidine kinase
MFPGPLSDPSNLQEPHHRPKPQPSPPPAQPPEEDVYLPIIFSAKTDAFGALTSTSASQPLPRDRLEALIQIVRENSAKSGQLTFDNSTYFYYATQDQNTSGQLLLFQNFDREQSVFRTIMTALAVIGVFCFIASLFGSLFLARRSMGPIQKSWNQQRDFLANASHELRTPMAVVQASLDVIRSNPDELVSEQKQWLNNIGESVEEMATLVDSLLFLARFDSHQHTINKKTFALDQAIMNALDPYKFLAETKKVKFSVSLTPGMELYGDEGRIKQVICILLDNALRHTPAGGGIKVILQKNNRNAQLTVSDTGEGIPIEHLKKIFERFYQVDPSRNKGGAGLGLSIAKCIVEAHDGGIQAISKVGAGASFFIRLPIATSHPLK